MGGPRELGLGVVLDLICARVCGAVTHERTAGDKSLGLAGKKHMSERGSLKVGVSSHGRQTEKEKRKQRKAGVRQKEIKKIKGDEKSRRGSHEEWK